MTTDEYEGDLFEAEQKITDATNWRGTANVSFGDETKTFGVRLLNETERQKVQNALPLAELREYQDDEQSEEHERLIELQQKEELTDEEENELNALSEEVGAEETQIAEALGMEAYEALMWAGKRAIMPTQGDINDILNAPMSKQDAILGKSGTMTSEEVEERLSDYLADLIDGQPYPIKLNVGMQAFMETLSVMGNGLDQ